MPPQIIDIPLAPVPASRPRVGRFSTYYGSRYSKFREEIQCWIATQEFLITKSPVRCTMVFKFTKKGKTHKECQDYCHIRADLDNLAKSILDAFTGVLWLDDSQVVDLHCSKICGREIPGILVTIQTV